MVCAQLFTTISVHIPIIIYHNYVFYPLGATIAFSPRGETFRERAPCHRAKPPRKVEASLLFTLKTAHLLSLLPTPWPIAASLVPAPLKPFLPTQAPERVNKLSLFFKPTEHHAKFQSRRFSHVIWRCWTYNSWTMFLEWSPWRDRLDLFWIGRNKWIFKSWATMRSRNECKSQTQGKRLYRRCRQTQKNEMERGALLYPNAHCSK